MIMYAANINTPKNTIKINFNLTFLFSEGNILQIFYIWENLLQN